MNACHLYLSLIYTHNSGLEMDPNEMSQTLSYLSENFTKNMIKHMNEPFIGLTVYISHNR